MGQKSVHEIELLLASASPRRRQLLRAAGINPLVRSVDVPEPVLPNESGHEMVLRLARKKAQAALAAHPAGGLILAADTTVLHDGHVLGKPVDRQTAVEMLMALRRGSHRVITAITLVDPTLNEELTTSTHTDLFMRNYQRQEVESYVASGSPMDKAGGYGIQDEAFRPVDMNKFNGCFTNVMGLPLCTLGQMLDHWGYGRSDHLIETCFDYHRHELQPIGELVHA